MEEQKEIISSLEITMEGVSSSYTKIQTIDQELEGQLQVPFKSLIHCLDNKNASCTAGEQEARYFLSL